MVWKEGDSMEGCLPKDPVMLLSYINTQLRDSYASLQELCQAKGVSLEEVSETLLKIDYRYDAAANQFK